MRAVAAPLGALLLLAGGCAEIRTPPPRPAPPDLVRGSATPAALADPQRAAIAAISAAFGDSGLGLAGHPGAAAQAAAQLEYLVLSLPGAPRYAAMADTVKRELTLAREEVRDALGIAQEGQGERVMRALLAAARALDANDEAAAAAALPAGLFRPGGAGSIRRFAEPGPLPQAARAATMARDEMARLDANNLWLQGTQQDGIQMETGTTGSGQFPGLNSPF